MGSPDPSRVPAELPTSKSDRSWLALSSQLSTVPGSCAAYPFKRRASLAHAAVHLRLGPSRCLADLHVAEAKRQQPQRTSLVGFQRRQVSPPLGRVIASLDRSAGPGGSAGRASPRSISPASCPASTRRLQSLRRELRRRIAHASRLTVIYSQREGLPDTRCSAQRTADTRTAEHRPRPPEARRVDFACLPKPVLVLSLWTLISSSAFRAGSTVGLSGSPAGRP